MPVYASLFKFMTLKSCTGDRLYYSLVDKYSVCTQLAFTIQKTYAICYEFQLCFESKEFISVASTEEMKRYFWGRMLKK